MQVKPLLRVVMVGITMASLAGCNTWSGDAINTFKVAISGPESQLTVERVNHIDAPVLLVELGVAEALMVSPGAGTGLVEWHGQSEMLLTRGGRVIQTAGLPADMLAPLAADDPFIQGLLSADGREISRQVDYPALYQTGLEQHAQYRHGKVESITFMGASHQLLRIDERIHMPELKFKAVNSYWVEPDTGLVRYSVQHIAPDLPPLRLTLVKLQGNQQP